jgi:hypothetical protein
MMTYADYMARIRTSVEALTMPPLSLLPQMLTCLKQEQDSALKTYQAKQEIQVKRAHAAKARLYARHQTQSSNRGDYRAVIKQLGDK